ncbi:SDR family NAD(P)-dependent oxidoreductase [Paenibacillus kobensis]|uniref:SDR family NAD(P)-dependent oxidoreductase n=1 Tax=Paenibacillus kobensis TaxID=59841 RepID=UPI000FDBF36D|nr:SDR family NAD(P)-dependent oxidoreductase [Paenibacillus kobensis]
MSSALIKQHILQQIQAGVLTPEEGFGKLEALRLEEQSSGIPGGNPAKGLRAEEDALLYVKPVWEEAGTTGGTLRSWPKGIYLLCGNAAQQLTSALSDSLRAAGRRAFIVRSGEHFETGGRVQDEIQLHPGSEPDYVRLADYISTLLGSGPDRLPLYVFHYAALDTDDAEIGLLWDERLLTGIERLFYMTKAFMAGKGFGEVKLTYLYSTAANGVAAQHEAVSSFARVIHHERTSFAFRAVGVDVPPGAAGRFDEQQVVEVLQAEANDGSFEPDVRWREGKRVIKRMAEVQPEAIGEDVPLWRPGGVYLLTGGMGGLGRAFASMLADRYKAKLVLCGRREPDADTMAVLGRLREQGAEAVYIRNGLSDRAAIDSLLDDIRLRFGQLNGVLHMAGVVKDRYLKDKSKEDFDTVLHAKIKSTMLLDEALQDVPLDLFCLFSSISAELGSAGQSDYAYGNGFMDYYAEYRERLRNQGMRSGRTLSVNWPLWRDGGMKVDEEAGKLVSRRLGIQLLELKDGFRALQRGLSGPESRFMVLSGDRPKMRAAFGLAGQELLRPVAAGNRGAQETAAASAAALSPAKRQMTDADVLELARRDLVASVAEFMKVPAADIGLNTDWSEYGFDSISFMNFSSFLNDRFGFELIPSVFFEYTAVGSLSEHLAHTYKDKLQSAAAGQSVAEEKETGFIPHLHADPADSVPWIDVPAPAPTPAEMAPAAQPTATEHQAFAGIKAASGREHQIEEGAAVEPVAIIGISGVMPQCDNADIFWSKIAAGENLVTEIPEDRWNWRDYYGDPMTEPNKTNVIWGGFMNDVDKFDPLFFNLSPKEAGLMDPQQRLVIEQAWKAIEDAGYKASALSGSNTGVYIGVGSMDYGEVLMESGVEPNGLSATGLAHCMIANRVSYLLNLHGPSEPIDTACSSSLVAIHKAVEAIRAGQCDLALAGGVSVILRPTYYIGLSKAAMLSPDGQCKAFDKDANGYVRGEGCGMLLLKPLSKALADGDHIYALVKGSGTNHGGHANTLTTPNPNAQADLLADCWRNSGIDPSTVGYIETHGTGTSLGDPIEINGLKKAFNRLYEERNLPQPAAPHCAFGSVKTNVGHLEAAAGMAGVLKVILSIKHGQIPASLHLNELNPYIQLDGSPFYPARTTEQWHRVRDAKGQLLPRRAGVSAFGFGGVNGHIILEEYVDDRLSAVSDSPQDKELIILSARNRERLVEYASRIGDYAADHFQRNSGMTLRQIAHTLQTGREEMEERLAFTAGSLHEMASVLRQFAGGDQPEGLFTGRVKSRTGDSVPESVDWILEETARKWTSGTVIDWRRHSESGGPLPLKAQLPTYPFARKRCWIPSSPQKAAGGYSASVHSAAADARYPAVNTYSVILKKSDILADHHRVDGRAVLPGAAQIELALYAARRTAGDGWKLSRIVWLEPVVVDQEEQEVAVTAQYGSGELLVELAGSRGGASAIYARAEFQQADSASRPETDRRSVPSDIEARCRYLGGQEWAYTPERSGDVAYGPYFQGLQQVWGSGTESLAFFRLPQLAARDSAKYELHPVVLDCVLQTLKGIQPVDRRDGAGTVLIPYALEGLEWIDPLPTQAYIYARVTGPNRFSIEMMDESGTVCLRVKEIALREIKSAGQSVQSEEWLFVPEWKPADASALMEHDSLGSNRQRILFIGSDYWEARWNGLLDEMRGLGDLFIIQYGSSSTRRVGGRRWEADQNDPAAYQVCLSEIGPVDHVYFLGGVNEKFSTELTLRALKETRDRGVVQLLRLAKPLLSRIDEDGMPLMVTVVTGGVFRVRGGERVDPAASELVGFALTLGLEQPKLGVCILDVDVKEREEAAHSFVSGLANSLRLRMRQVDGTTVMAVRNGVVHTRSMASARLPAADPRELPFRNQGVYMIVGGAGGIGHVLALYLARTLKARLVLTGRSPLDEEKRNRLRMIEEAGGQALYVQADASDCAAMHAAVEEANRRFGPIQGAVHSAAVLRDVTVKRMTEQDLMTVLSAKSEGSVVLANALADEPLDFMLFFSSAVSLAGSPGQANYAAGSSFTDAYALSLAELRPYPVRVINWGYWGSVGVASDEWHYKKLLAQGIHPITPEEGIDAVVRITAGTEKQVMPFKAERAFLQKMGIAPQEGYRDRSAAIVTYNNGGAVGVTATSQTAAVDAGDLERQAIGYIRRVFAEALALDAEEMDERETFEAYGVDSVVVLDINRLLERDFGKLPSTLLFEYMTIEKLADYLLSHHANRLHEMFRITIEPAIPVAQVSSHSAADVTDTLPDSVLRERTTAYICGVFAEALALDPDEIDPSETFETYGVDSVVVLDINRLLERDFGKLPSTLLFEYMTADKLTGYLLAQHKERLERMLSASDIGVQRETERSEAPEADGVKVSREARAADNVQTSLPDDGVTDIAIIGVSGKYPQADDLGQYWDNLLHGRDCITEIPSDRWRWQDYFDTSEGAPGKTYSKWGGFLSDVDKFDPLFFSISPAEAEGMDPQERLFLQTAWAALEDAGITRRELSDMAHQIGVFVGVMNADYEWLGAQATTQGILTHAHSNFWSIANRVSYVLDLHGPSLAVDTACSSSLTALHLACESLKRKECKAAIAGGVHLILHPAHYTRYSSVGMLSHGDQVKAFGDGADGFVDGEGVGAVLLKPLADAVKDGDRIYGVIKSTAINSGGKTSGFTVPNLAAQADLVVDALRKSGIDPRTVSYVEAHGTGTSLGDPIEVAALTKAYRTFTPDMNYCAVGTVKSNVGHLESAAGIAALTKVVLQMNHGTIAPSLHSQPPNPKIDFEQSPFYVAQQPMSWERPVLMKEGHAIEYPRRAGISSFGAGGSNAHVLVEEYVPSGDSFRREEQSGPSIVVLSAKNRDRLREYAGRIASYIRHELTDHPERSRFRLDELCYTLQTGREPMEERIALSAASLEEAASKLAAFHQSGEAPQGAFQSSLKGKRKRKASSGSVEDQNNVHAPAVIQEWLSGAEIDWKAMYTRLPRRIGLPTYPFAQERYWISDDNVSLPDRTSVSAAAGIHPMLDSNVSTMQTQRFLKKWTGDEPYLRDHRAGHVKILPAAAYLAMAWAAGNRSTDRQATVRLTGLSWHHPLIVRDVPVQAEIRLEADGAGAVFVVASQWAADEIVHAAGKIEFGDVSVIGRGAASIDLHAVRGRCGGRSPGDHFYAKLRQAGMEYGPSFQVVQSLSYSDEEALSELQAPSDALNWGGSSGTIHPALLDGAFQTAAAASIGLSGSLDSYLPFGADSLDVYDTDASVHFAYAIERLPRESGERQGAEKRYDVSLLDAEGNEAAVLRGLVLRRTALASEPATDAIPAEQEVEDWLEQMLTGELSADAVEQLVGGWING